MKTSKLTAALVVVTAALCMAPVAASAAERAGEAVRVQPDSYQRDGFFPSFLEVGDEIVREAKLYTDEFGSLDVRLDDGSNLTLGPNSEVVIDEYVYSPGGSTGGAAITLGQGVLRMISGNLPKDSVRIDTPVATIGIRGTDFWLDTNTSGSVKIWVDDGIVSAAPNGAAQVFEFEAPAFAVCSATSCERSGPAEKPQTYPAGQPEGPEERDGGDGGGGGSD